MREFRFETPNYNMETKQYEKEPHRYRIEGLTESVLLVEKDGQRKIVKFKCTPCDSVYHIQKTQVKSKYPIEDLIQDLADEFVKYDLWFIKTLIDKTLETTKEIKIAQLKRKGKATAFPFFIF